MPAVTLSDADKRYVERLRKKFPMENVPTVKEAMELILEYVEAHETDFIAWVKSHKGE